MLAVSVAPEVVANDGANRYSFAGGFEDVRASGGLGLPRSARLWKAACIVLLVVPLLSTGRAEAVAAPIRLYVFAGQSNMVGYSAVTAKLPTVDPKLTAPVPNVRFWGPIEDYSNRWTTLQAPTEVVQTAYHSGFGPELSAASVLGARHPGATVAVVKLARNGTNLGFDWRPGNVIGLYPLLIDRVRLAKHMLESQEHTRVEIAGFFWMQGESETVLKRAADAYAANLGNFIRSARKDLGAPNMSFVIGRIANLKRVGSAYRYSDTVRLAQEEVAHTLPRTYIVSTDGLERDPSSPLHFDTRGEVDLGRRFAANRRIPV
jgi:hypothetical protein